MAYVGNLNGPRKSEILAKLGNQYFDITPEELEREIRDYEDEEANNIVDPVYVDENGRFYLIFTTSEGNIRRFYLDEHGYLLKGKILKKKI